METLSWIAQRLDARLTGADATFERVVTDTRDLRAGDLFVALRGERHDGHDFLHQAAQSGAAGALVERRHAIDLPQIEVPDTLNGLQRAAVAWRERYAEPVVAVTGSNGKTTTKQMMATIFRARGPVLATRGNLNNHIGVPLTLLELRPEHRTAVIEMGANHAGEIARLAGFARPDVGIVTQAGDAHLEGFGSREGVARAKGELFAALGRDGIAIINADDAYAPLWREMARTSSRIEFGMQGSADVVAEDLYELEGGEGTEFSLRTPTGQATVRLPLPGRHNVMNALAAAAGATALGLVPELIADGLSAVEPVQGRVRWKRTRSGAQLIDDSYNANPSSLRAGLALLARSSGQRWVVLGDMAELGPQAAELHRQCGAAAREEGIDRLFAAGRYAGEYAQGFGAGSEAFADVEPLVRRLQDSVDASVTLLVKGSRSARMERVVAALTETPSGESH
jgi:UDP-N-acetylmuramoyl-tripeptide--D-alanyl-D-alanine ligase